MNWTCKYKREPLGQLSSEKCPRNQQHEFFACALYGRATRYHIRNDIQSCNRCPVWQEAMTQSERTSNG